MFLGALDYEPMKINRSLSTGCRRCQRRSRHMISLLCIAKIKLLLQEDATELAEFLKSTQVTALQNSTGILRAVSVTVCQYQYWKMNVTV